MEKVNGHGSIRKVKGGAVGVLALSVLFLGVSQVSADEATNNSQPESTVVSESTNASNSGEEQSNVESRNVESTKETELPTETKTETSENQTKSNTSTTKENFNVETAIKELKDAGLEVVVGKEIVTTSPQETAKALEGLKQQVTKALDAKQELDIAFLDLKEKAKNAGILTKEGKTLTFDTAKEAKEHLEKQAKEVNQLIATLNKEHEQLLNVAKETQKAGIAVAVTPALKADSVEDATAAISAQIDKLNTLIKSVEDNKALIDSVTNKAKEAGVALEGEIVIESKAGEETQLSEKVSNNLKGLEVATNIQKSTKNELDKLIEDARAKGLNISISGEKKVLVSKVPEEIEAVKSKIAEELANNSKKANDYAEALKAAKNANRLSEDSTAKKEGDIYKQTVSIKSEGTGGSVSVKTSDNAEIVSVELIDPSGTKVTSVKTLADLTAYSQFDKKGSYTVNYSFRPKDDAAGSVTLTVNTKGVEPIKGEAKGELTITTKTPTIVNKENQIAPLTTVHVYDYSSSYAGKLKDSLRLSRKIIEANNNPESKHILQTYVNNFSQTYQASTNKEITGLQGVSSKLLSKEEALDLIDRLLTINAPSEKNPSYFNYGDYFKGVAQTFGENRYIDENNKSEVPFEDIVTKLTKQTDTISVIQYTDGWMDGKVNGNISQGTPEEMDKTFASWAKQRAKTFMTVVNRNQVTPEDTNSQRSLEQMRELGHPNIYDMTGKDPKVVQEEVVKQFMETATEKITATKGEDQLIEVVIGGDTVKVVKATLKGAVNKNLNVSNGKLNYSEKLPEGNWTINYELEGNGDVSILATVDGKVVVKEVKTLKETKGAEGSISSKTDNLKAVTLPTPPAITPITIENIKVLAKNVQLGKVETEISPVTIEKELNPVTFKETVSSVKTVTPQNKKVLPNTGESKNSNVQAAALGLGLVGLLTLAGSAKSKKDL